MKTRFDLVAIIAVIYEIMSTSSAVSAQINTGRFTINMGHGKVEMKIGRKSTSNSETTVGLHPQNNIAPSVVTDVNIKNEDYTSSQETTESRILYSENDRTLRYGNHTYSFVEVGRSSFKMGATDEQQGEAETSEFPVHRVDLFSFWLGQTEVPQWLWRIVMNENPSYNVGDDNPVENVSWEDCRLFIEKLSTLTGKEFRMPTEAQMELALRNGNFDNQYKYGIDQDLVDVAWYAANSGGHTHPVGLKKPNGLRLYDIIGNVGEWCYDWFDAYSNTRETGPKGPEIGTKKVYRSASYDSDPKDCRTSVRFADKPDFKSPRIGLRLAIYNK